MAKIFPKGIFFQKPRENAPEFVRGSLSFKVDEAIQFLNEHKNAQGYVNIDMLKSEKGIYLALNEWKKPDFKKDPELERARNSETKTPSNGRNSDGSLPPNFDKIQAEEVFNSWNDKK